MALELVMAQLLTWYQHIYTGCKVYLPATHLRRHEGLQHGLHQPEDGRPGGGEAGRVPRLASDGADQLHDGGQGVSLGSRLHSELGRAGYSWLQLAMTCLASCPSMVSTSVTEAEQEPSTSTSP